MKLPLFILFFITISISKGIQTTDLPVKVIDGKKYLVYTVQQSDGWFKIAKKFNVKYAELRLANKDSGDKLIVGKKILIPTIPLKSNDPAFDKNYIDNDPVISKNNFLYHTVVTGQTLYSISKIYKASIDQIKKWNNLNSNEILVGQDLIVGISKNKNEEKKIEEAPLVNKPPVNIQNNIRRIKVPLPVDESEMDPSAACIPEASSVAPPPPEYKEAVSDTLSIEKVNENDLDDAVKFGDGRMEIKEEGIALWSDEENSSPEKYYAFHKTAPAGTIIKVVNYLNAKKVYVKVIGKLNNAPENEDVIIKISKVSADRLGMLQKKFQVKLQYGINK